MTNVLQPEIREDFFQRIKDVNWDVNPLCHFMIGEGGSIVNNRIVSAGGDFYTSSDGAHWAQTTENFAGTGDQTAGIYCGIWMRPFFRRDMRPLWILGGFERVWGGVNFPNLFMNRPILATSRDGVTYTTQYLGDAGSPVNNLPAPDLYVNKIEVIPAGLNPSIAVATVNRTALNQFYGTFSSRDGLNWGADAPEVGGGPDEDPPPVIDTNQIYQIGNSTTAHGKVRSGRHKGRNITVRVIGGGYQVAISDTKTGDQLGVANTGVTRCQGIAYGRYMFVACGADISRDGCIAWSDNALDWTRLRRAGIAMLHGPVVGARE